MKKKTMLTASINELMEHAKLSPELQADIGWICLGFARDAGFETLPQLLAYIKQRLDLERKGCVIDLGGGGQYIPTR